MISILNQHTRLSTVDVSLFLRQLATLIYTGVPIIKSCDLLEKCQQKMLARLMIHHIKRELLSGKTLHESLGLASPLFDELTCHLVRIGEHTGKLDLMLCTIADYQEKSLAYAKKIKQLLFYPCIVLITAFIVTLSMFIFIIPRFAELFQSSHAKLPFLTSCIFSFSTQLNQHLFLMSSALCVFPLCFYMPFSRHFKSHLTHCISQWPFIRTFLRQILLARFARNLAITCSAGIPIHEALKLSAHTVRNTDFTSSLAKLRAKISAGLSLHQAMAALPYFPVLMIQMIKICEESGMLDLMLEKTAHFIETDIDHVIHQFSQLLEPLIMLILGVLIGVLVISLYLPLFKLGSAL
jgi:type IV pilus assembly protein PilC